MSLQIRNVTAGAMVIAMALCLLAGVVWFGAVSVNLAAPVYAAAVLAGLLWAVKLFFVQPVSWKASPMHWPVLAFAAYTLARYFTSPVEYESRMDLFRVVLLAFIYFLCAFNLYRSRDRTILFAVLLTLALAEAIYGMWQFGTKSDSVLYATRPEGYSGRASGTYICPNHLAGFLEMVIALAIGRTAVQRFSRSAVEKSALQKVFVVYITLFLITGLVLTLSRSSWVSLAAALSTLWFWGKWDWRVLWPRLAATAVAICVIGIVAYNIKPVRVYIQNTLSGEQVKDGSTLRDPSLGGRTLMWQATTAMIKDHPLAGTGPGTWQWHFPSYRPKALQIHPEFAHNDVLQLAAEYGVIGFAIVAWAFVAFFWHAAKIVRHNSSSEQRAFAVGSALAVTTLLVHSWFDFNMHVLGNAVVLVTLMGLVAAMDAGEDLYPRVELKRPVKYALGVAVLVVCGLGAWFVTPSVLAHHYLDQAEQAQEAMDLEEAADLIYKAVGHDSKFPDAHATLGQIYYATSRWLVGDEKKEEREDFLQGAVRAFERSLKQNPFQGWVLLRLGASYEILGKLENATNCYDRAVALEPTSAFVYEELGLFYQRRGDQARALAAYETAKQIGSSITSHLNAMDLSVQPQP